jgi:hypothetical protein
MLSSHLRLGISSGLFPSDLPIRTLDMTNANIIFVKNLNAYIATDERIMFK